MYDQGRIVLSKKARNRHEELKTRIFVPKDGYIEAYVVNESDEDVWFDQFRILSTGPVIVQETHYDPWGVELQGLGYQQGGLKVNKYLYNGKEFNDHLGLNLFDYGARMYDASVGRWFTVDPLAESDLRSAPYVYVFNNPLLFIDPDGRFGDFFDRKGNFLGNDGKKDGKIYLLNEGKRAMTEDSRVNWGGTLSQEHASKLKGASSEVGGLIIQNRIEEGGDYTISEFKTIGGNNEVTGFMLEPGGPSTKTANQDKRIPEGVYDIATYSSKKYPDNFLLSNKDVSEDRKILYHSGNSGANTEGCNMPGGTKDSKNGTVGSSKAKMAELRDFIKSKGAENVKTIINNNIPENK